MMDPIFGLPCINDSRAMDNARNRNYIAEKNLLLKFESLDLAKKSASGKLLTNRYCAGDFLESLDLNAGKSPRRGGHRDRQMTRSMSLRELDKRITEVKDRKYYVQSPIQIKKLTRKASNPNSTIVVKKEPALPMNTFDSSSSHIVHLEHHERCLPINRQKHAMRDAYERATTEDVYFKRQRALPTNHSPISDSPHRDCDRLSCESPGYSKALNGKQNQHRKTPRS